MSKILLLADLHFSNNLPHAKGQGRTDRLQDLVDALHRATATACENKVNNIIVAGDIFHRKTQDPHTLQAAAESFHRLAELAPVYLIGGNHDIDATMEVFASDFLGELHDRIHVMRDETVTFDGVPYHFMPYRKNDAAMAYIAKHADPEVVLICHQDIIGATGQAGWVSDIGIHPSLFAGYRAVFSGHYHKPQCFLQPAKGFYIGAPIQHNFGDAGEPRGCVILEDRGDRGLSPTFSALDESPRFHVRKYDHDTGLATATTNLLDGDYVRIDARVPVEHQKRVLQALTEQFVDGYGVRDLIVNFERIERPKARLLKGNAADKVEASFDVGAAIRSYADLHAAKAGLDPAAVAAYGQEILNQTAAQVEDQGQKEPLRFGQMEATNFCLFPDLVFDWGVPGLHGIFAENLDSSGASSNGSGKSTIAHCLSWILFDEMPNGDKKDAAISEGAKFVEASLDIWQGDTCYTITRRRTKKKLTLTVTSDTGPSRTYEDQHGPVAMPFAGNEDAQQWIEKSLLGMDFGTFCATVFFAQNYTRRFANPALTDSERKTILKNAADLDIYDKAGDVVRARSQELLGLRNTELRAAEDIENRQIPLLAGQKSQPQYVAAQAQGILDRYAEREQKVRLAQEAAREQREEWDLARSALAPETEVEAWKVKGAALNQDIFRLTRERDALVGNQATVQANTQARESAQRAYDEASARQSVIESQVAQLANVENVYNTTNEELQKLRAQRPGLVATVSQHTFLMEEAAKQLALFKAGQCPTCSTPVTGEHISAHLEGIKTKGKNAKTDRGNAMCELALLDNAIKLDEQALLGLTPQMQQLAALRSELPGQLAKKQQAAKTLATVPVSTVTPAAIALQVRQVEAEKARAEEAAKEIRQKIEEHGAALLHCDMLGKMAQAAEETYKTLAAALPNAEDAAKQLAEANAAIAEIDRQIAGLQYQAATSQDQAKVLDAELEMLEFWQTGFGYRGLPSYMLDAILYPLTVSANSYLSMLSDGGLYVTFDTESTLKNGNVVERFAIERHCEGKTSRPSGGQEKRFEIACDLALMDILAQRNARAIDLLIFDECLDGLDSIGQVRVMDLLRELTGKRGSIWVISHDEGLPDVFQQIVKVRKQDGWSQIVGEDHNGEEA